MIHAPAIHVKIKPRAVAKRLVSAIRATVSMATQVFTVRMMHVTIIRVKTVERVNCSQPRRPTSHASARPTTRASSAKRQNARSTVRMVVHVRCRMVINFAHAQTVTRAIRVNMVLVKRTIVDIGQKDIHQVGYKVGTQCIAIGSRVERVAPMANVSQRKNDPEKNASVFTKRPANRAH